MRLINLGGRAAIQTGESTAVDLAEASGGRFGPDPASVYEAWADVLAWYETAELGGGERFDPRDLGAPSPRPRQILAIGLNYDSHAAESGFEAPTQLPPVFPKFLSSLSGPVTEVALPEGGNTDWEVELVVVIGKEGYRVAAADAWDHVAGLTVGNDLSERIVQLRGPAPQFGLGKSYPGFAPTGPATVTPDELPDRDDLRIGCTLDDEQIQDGRTSQLIFDVARLIEGLTEVVTLYPGDLVFTGTPEGVGLGRDPQRYISAGQTLVSSVEGIGELRQHFVKEA